MRVAVVCALLALDFGQAVKPPHVVFLLGDEVGYNNVQWHSNITRTPHLQALADGGLRLSQHYVQRWCAPTRAALMTGRYPYNTGMMNYGHGKGFEEERSAVPLSFSMLPKLLSRAPTPYVSHWLGKVCAAQRSATQHRRARRGAACATCTALSHCHDCIGLTFT